jgi:aspartyl-tRNA(Asn)/glutamyl-tRNA(Gln) amidotransferase subunit A
MFSNYTETRKALNEKKVTCKDIVTTYLKNIQAKNGELNAFLEVYEVDAIQKAELVDKKLATNTAGKLAGFVIGIKDVLAYQDHSLQGASKILDGFKSQFTATAVQRLLDEDAIIIGRNNCDEFAMGSTNESSAFGAVRNAADTSRVSGGSSGGSAVAVQANMCLASLGSDTGGSVRQPAAFCGIVGLKPTYSRISRFGLVAYASSFDCIGIFAHHVDDVALLLEVMAGADDFDSTVSRRPVPTYTQHLQVDFSTQKPKICYIKETIENEGLNAEVKAATLKKIDALKAQGFTVESVDFPLLPYILPTYYILTTAEASTNLSRYDGVKYGYRSPNTTDLVSLYKKTRSEGFGTEVKRRIMLGTFVLSASYYDAYFTKAQKVRRLIKEKTQEIFKKYDFIIMPVAPTVAPKLGELAADNPLQMYLADIFSVQANVTGIPAMAVPNGTDAQGLPIGIQVMADFFEEAPLMAFSKYLTTLN